MNGTKMNITANEFPPNPPHTGTAIKPLLQECTPASLGDLVLPQRVRDALETCIETACIPNFLFHGRPGLGKSTAARILQTTLTVETGRKTFCGAEALTVDALKKLAKGIREGWTLLCDGCPAIVVVDDADKASRDAQIVLLGIIDTYGEHVRFILTTNHPDQLEEGLVSRCEVHDFSSLTTHDVVARLEQIAVQEDLHATADQLKEIAKDVGVDIRRAIQELDRITRKQRAATHRQRANS